MPRIFFFLLFSLLGPSVFAQDDPGIWAGGGDYKPGESIGSFLKNIGGEKRIFLQVSAAGAITGTLNVTYDKSAATTPSDAVDLAFIISGKYDGDKNLLLLVVTHLKAANGAGTDRPFIKPDSLFYDVKIGKDKGKIEMTGAAGEALNKYANAEWLGSNRNAAMGLPVSPNLNMHLLPLSIRLEKSVPFTEAGAPVAKNEPPTPQPQIDKRKTEIQHTIVLDTTFVKLDMYDNGEVDGNTATLILDGKIIINSVLLTTKAVSISLHLSKDKPEHFLELYANNEGSIPPNTALLVLTCNRKRYEINLSSNGKANGTVKLIFPPQ